MYRRLYRLAPRVPDVDSVSGTAALNSPLCGRWDWFQHFNTSDADVEASELFKLLNAAMLQKEKRSSEVETWCQNPVGTAMNHMPVFSFCYFY